MKTHILKAFRMDVVAEHKITVKFIIRIIKSIVQKKFLLLFKKNEISERIELNPFPKQIINKADIIQQTGIMTTYNIMPISFVSGTLISGYNGKNTNPVEYYGLPHTTSRDVSRVNRNLLFYDTSTILSPDTTSISKRNSDVTQYVKLNNDLDGVLIKPKIQTFNNRRKKPNWGVKNKVSKPGRYLK